MRLRTRIALRYGAIAAVAMLVLGGLYRHERVTERRLRAALPPGQQAEADLGDPAEAVVYTLIPLILVAGWWITRQSLAPLGDLAQEVERKGVETLGEPIARTGNGDEVDRLAAAFNAMAARVDASFRQIREFTLHASHELKTPLTVMRAEVEGTLLDDRAGSSSQRETLQSLASEIQRLTTIVDGLTLLTKVDAGLVELERRPTALAELVRDCFEDAQVLAEPHGVIVSLAECEECVVDGSRDRLRQLLLNLVDNAVKYNGVGGRVVLRLRRRDGFAEIEITNTGSGVPDSLMPRVFDRFVRGDEARRAVEGCGLGLSIARWVAEAHGGTLTLASDAGLTTATVRLPLA